MIYLNLSIFNLVKLKLQFFGSLRIMPGAQQLHGASGFFDLHRCRLHSTSQKVQLRIVMRYSEPRVLQERETPVKLSVTQGHE